MFACIVALLLCCSLACCEDYGDKLQLQNEDVSPPLIAGIPYGSVSGRVAEYFATMKPSVERNGVAVTSYGNLPPAVDAESGLIIDLQSI